MKAARGVTVVALDDGNDRMAIQVDGIVIYIGSPEECQRRIDVLYRNATDAPARDRALGRAIQYA